MFIGLVTHSYKNYEYFLKKNSSIGNINGYVIIKPGQKGYNHSKPYDDTDEIMCHGGITYDSNKYGKFAELDPKYRVIGFDTLHAGDYNPAMAKIRKQARKDNPSIFNNPFLKYQHHWTKPELAHECKTIIDQLNRL